LKVFSYKRKTMEQRKFNLEDRLIKFACICLEICDLLPNSRTGQNLEFQLSKSSTASALVYGEAQAAESKPDFIHKVKIVLKELRETKVNLRIIMEKPVLVEAKLHIALQEANELIAIFIKSIETAKQNMNAAKLKNS
jgi:four helix bundle protein